MTRCTTQAIATLLDTQAVRAHFNHHVLCGYKTKLNDNRMIVIVLG